MRNFFREGFLGKNIKNFYIKKLRAEAEKSIGSFILQIARWLHIILLQFAIEVVTWSSFVLLVEKQFRPYGYA